MYCESKQKLCLCGLLLTINLQLSAWIDGRPPEVPQVVLMMPSLWMWSHEMSQFAVKRDLLLVHSHIKWWREAFNTLVFAAITVTYFSFLFSHRHTQSLYSVRVSQPCHLPATGKREIHLLPEPAADLELTFCDEDLLLIPGLFALMPCSFPP